jgi:hypothetical protein
VLNVRSHRHEVLPGRRIFQQSRTDTDGRVLAGSGRLVNREPVKRGVENVAKLGVERLAAAVRSKGPAAEKESGKRDGSDGWSGRRSVT